MSYFDDASLVMIPSGYKDQKVYSVKPIDGSGDLTFSRASNATRVNSSGLVEKVRTNLVTYSNDFSNAIWQKDGGTSLTANAGTDPNGGNDAWEVVMPSGGNLYQNSTPSWNGAQSVYAKVASGTESIKLWNGVSGTTFNLTTSWQRISVINVNAGQYINVYNDSGSSVTFLIAFAQAETGDIATDYIATTSAAVSVGPVSGLPRLDYSGGATCPSLLLEPQRSNVVLFSEQIDNAAWTKDGSTCTANQTTSPSGYVDADLITNNGGAADHSVLQQYALSASTAYSVSAYVKKGTEQYVFFALNYGPNANEWASATFNLDAGTSGNYSNILSAPTSTITSVGNDWYRVTMTATTATSGTHILIIGFGKAGAPDTSRGRYIADNTNTFYLWGCQLEQGAYATSYIPTLSTAVTRVNDYTYKASSTIAADAKTWFCDANITEGNVQPNVMFLTLRGGPYEGYFRYFDSNGLAFQYYGVSGSVSISLANAIPAGTTQRVKMAARIEDNDFAFYVNGVQVGTETGSTRGTGMNLLEVGTYGTGSQYCISDSINQVLLFPTALSNADLATLTTL